MQLAPGARVGPYEILSALGAGGMGEVYRARDSRLNREVAIKVVRPAFVDDADRVTRLQREAQLLAALNHPNVAQIHGIEEADGHRALVMELVEGPTLADRIAWGALPLHEALPIARQIVDALEAAHASGIIHRDLKPANIKVREDGTVKVLDFGLAKALSQDVATGAGAVASPTISLHATAAGIILGTAAYMSPEQARGRTVDRRADIWAFGAVLYEMLTGRRAFDADDSSDTLALILTKEPDWSALPAETPAAIRRLLRRCLDKDIRRRLPDITVARLEIDEGASNPAVDSVPATAPPARGGWLLPFAAGGVFAALATAVVMWFRVASPPAAPAPVTRFGITLPADQQIAISFNDRDITLSPDGLHLVYTAGAESQLMVRAIDRLEPRALPGTANARAPFVSPDSQWVGFFDRLDEGLTTGPVVRGVLKRAPLSGGPPIVIASVTGGSRGASWARDDSIILATSDTTTGLLRVSARGGEPEVLTRPRTSDGERDHHFPSILPGGRAVLFTIVGPGNARRVALLDSSTGQWRTLLRSGSQAEYVNSGHLIYEDAGALWAVPFDVEALEVSGDPVPVLERVTWRDAAANFTVTRDGMLAYAASAGAGDARSLVWVDRRGGIAPVPSPQRSYLLPRLSPDGTRVAVSVIDRGESAFWMWDFSLQRLTPVRTEQPERLGAFSVWTPDSRYLVYGAFDLFYRAADGTGVQQLLTIKEVPGDAQYRAIAVTPDGKRLIFEQRSPGTSYDLRMLDLDVTGGATSTNASTLFDSPSDERNGSVSPDGRWLAYESNKTGRFQIYVTPFPNVNDAEYQISTEGGRTPLFSPDGRELFFVNGSALMSAPLRLAPAFSAGNPVTLFDIPSLILDARLLANTGRMFDISRDGQRFLMVRDDTAATAEHSVRPAVVIVQNWHPY